MLMARAGFGPVPKGVDKTAFEDLIHTYMAALLHNFQVLDDYNLAFVENALFAYALLPTANPPEEESFSDWSRQALEELVSVTDSAPVWEVLDTNSAGELVVWDAQAEFVLYTTMLEKSSPLLCLKSNMPVAV